MLKLVSQFALLALLFARANFANAQPPIDVAQHEAKAHRISSVNWIRKPGTEGFQGLWLRISVGEKGAVTAAEVTSGPEELRAAAIALAKTWRYKPFERSGQPVPAIVTDVISILPPERPYSASTLFPVVRNWASVKITLKRTRCYGPCPAYEVQIDGNGDVVFNETFPQESTRRRHISRAELEGLLEFFRKSNYFSLDPEYHMLATDLPTYITSISIDGQFMSVRDYAGLHVGMPASVRDVEDAIDEIAGTHEWLNPVK
jgi:hypothetical protein